MADMTSDVVTTTLAANERWAANDHAAHVPKVPGRELAVVTCMDARIDPYRAFGIELGMAHVIRNAGAIVTPDVERSLLLSQYALDTTTVLVVGHTDCGLLGHDEQATGDLVHQRRGARPAMPLGSIDTPESGVVASVQRLRTSATLRHRHAIWGLVFDVDTGRLAVVDAPDLGDG